MKKLTVSDWVEIYYAVQEKRERVRDLYADAKWIRHLDGILAKIGPDGERAKGA